jgi:hypothetical protein
MGSASLPWFTDGSRLAPAVQPVMDVNASTSTQEMNMSQKTHQNPAPKQAPTSGQQQQQQRAPITGVSPDDPFPGDPGGPTSKPGSPAK